MDEYKKSKFLLDCLGLRALLTLYQNKLLSENSQYNR